MDHFHVFILVEEDTESKIKEILLEYEDYWVPFE